MGSVDEEDLGFETPQGDVLCGPCYFTLWGPRGAKDVDPGNEGRRPESRRPETIGPFWTPGPLGELDEW